jgi:flagellar hook-associated protein 2
MSRLAITGLISNLDTDNIINSLVEVERIPIKLLEKKKEVQNQNLAALQNLNARMLSLSMSADSLSKVSTFQDMEASSSNPQVLVADAGAAAEEGSYQLEVEQLAATQSVGSAVFSDNTEALGIEGQFVIDGETFDIKTTDTLQTIVTAINNRRVNARASVLMVGEDEYRMTLSNIQSGENPIEIYQLDNNNVLEQLGLVSGATTIADPVTNGAKSGYFTDTSTAIGTHYGLSSPAVSGTVTLDDGSGPVNVTIDLETDSLQAIADAINAEATAQGSTITASVVSEDFGGQELYQLEITGAADVSLTDDNNVLQAMKVLRPEFANELQTGQNAVFYVNGARMERPTNFVNGVIPGVSFSLLQPSPGNPVTLTVSAESETATKEVERFVESYNQVRSFILEQTAFDPETLQKGILLGDSSVMMVERNLFDMTSNRVADVLLRDFSDLNEGSGVDPGKIKITDSRGNSAEFDFSLISSVDQIVDRINRNSEIEVRVSANGAGDGLNIEDLAGGYGSVQIEDLDGGSMAQDLGIAGSTKNGIIRGESISESRFYTLSDFGVSINRNGTLSFDSGKLNSMFNQNPTLVQRAFSVSTYGIMDQASDKLDLITSQSSGTISNRMKSIQTVIKDIDNRIGKLERRAVAYEERLQKQYANLEITLANLQSQSEYLNNQLADLGNVFAPRGSR